MPSQPSVPLEVVEEPGGVTVVRLLTAEILDDGTAVAIGDRLIRLTGRDRLRLVLNLSSVRAMNSTLVAKLFVLRRKLTAAGGRLALCGVESHLLEVFQVVKLTDRVSLYGDEGQAVQALGAAG